MNTPKHRKCTKVHNIKIIINELYKRFKETLKEKLIHQQFFPSQINGS